MRHDRIFLTIITFLFTGCLSVNSPMPVLLEHTLTAVPVQTHTALPTVTATSVPISTDISCVPSQNPFVLSPLMGGSEYGAGLYPNIDITRVCTFSGHISRGQVYKHQIAEGLIFCLVPSGIFAEASDEGWSIVLSDSSPGGCDFNSVDFVDFGHIVTPPFRGNLWFDVYGWHFRNKQNTGENDGSVNAPQNERFFNFVFNRKDYETIWYSMRCNEWKMDTDCAMATQSSIPGSEIPRSRAKFTITELKLGNLIPNSHAWIESMEFTVDVYLADE